MTVWNKPSIWMDTREVGCAAGLFLRWDFFGAPWNCFWKPLCESVQTTADILRREARCKHFRAAIQTYRRWAFGIRSAVFSVRYSFKARCCEWRDKMAPAPIWRTCLPLACASLFWPPCSQWYLRWTFILHMSAFQARGACPGVFPSHCWQSIKRAQHDHEWIHTGGESVQFSPSHQLVTIRHTRRRHKNPLRTSLSRELRDGSKDLRISLKE